MNAPTIWPFELTIGASDHPRNGACLLSAISWLVYADLDDHPPCVSEVIAELARNINDLLPDDERQELKEYIPRLVGTADDSVVEDERVLFLNRYIIDKLFPLGLASAGLEFLVPALRKLRLVSIVGLKPFVDEIIGQALRDPSWPDAAMSVLQSRIERGLWSPTGVTTPETMRSVLESIVLTMQLQPQMASRFHEDLIGLLDGVLQIGRRGPFQIDFALAEERIQAFRQAA